MRRNYLLLAVSIVLVSFSIYRIAKRYQITISRGSGKPVNIGIPGIAIVSPNASSNLVEPWRDLIRQDDYYLRDEYAVSNAFQVQEAPKEFSILCDNNGHYIPAFLNRPLDYTHDYIRTSRFDALVVAWKLRKTYDEPPSELDKFRSKVHWVNCADESLKNTIPSVTITNVGEFNIYSNSFKYFCMWNSDGEFMMNLESLTNTSYYSNYFPSSFHCLTLQNGTNSITLSIPQLLGLFTNR